MEGIAVGYFLNIENLGNKETKSELYSYISDDNEQDACDPHAHMVNLFKILIELVLLVFGLHTVWEDTYGCAKQYMCALAIF